MRSCVICGRSESARTPWEYVEPLDGFICADVECGESANARLEEMTGDFMPLSADLTPRTGENP